MGIAQVVDPSQVLAFTFDGRTYPGLAGDTIASALYRAGVRVFSRSFKYHRPRGLMCVNGTCPNCLVNVNGTPNVRACITPLEAGIHVRSQNAWPSLTYDLLAINDKLDRLLPVGFYYKTFFRPRFMWPVYETVLRHAAGLGKVDPDPDRFEEPYFDKAYRHADVTVVGGGPAGMAAALASAGLGARVALVEGDAELGGHLRYQVSQLEPEIHDLAHRLTQQEEPARPASTRPGNTHRARSTPTAFELARSLADAVYANPHIEVLTEAVAFGWYEGNMVGVAQGSRLIKLRTAQLVVATGQFEQPLVFGNNDLPGVFLGSGLQRLMNLYAVRPGERALVVTTHDFGWAVAANLLDQDVDVAIVADSRPEIPESQVVAQVQAAGALGRPSATILSARGKGRVTGAVVVQLDEDGRHLPGSETELECDVISLSTGFAPNNALLYQSGCKFDYESECGNPVPIKYPPGVRAAGGAVSGQEIATILLEGQVAGLEAGLSLQTLGDGNARQQLEDWQGRLVELKARARSTSRDHPLASLPTQGEKKFVCFCEDVTEKDIGEAVAEGFDEIETLKRYSTISMGPCQGKMCSANALRLCARQTSRSVADVGTTTSRPPFTPVELGILAGRKLEPVRLSPIHERHLALGARMMDAGQWKRPEHYGNPQAEVQAVRERVGIIDVSTLGKIDVQGPDAAQFLERVYTSRLARTPVGRVRYGVMCTEEGIIFDDGVVARLDDDRFYVTTTTGGINSVFEWLTWWLAGWGLHAHVTNVTGSYAAVNLAGPHARDVLARLTEADVSNEALPYMHVRRARVAEVPARLVRVGFVGEMGYEIHVPAEYGATIWDRLMEAGSELGITPFGVEAQRVLRLEKKHLIVGQDTDALSDPFGADAAWAVRLDKEDFIGKPSLARIGEGERAEQLVGFEMRDASIVPAEGAQMVEDGHLVGRVTSARYSPTLGKAIGMGWVLAKSAHEGAAIQIRTSGTLAEARVVCQPFYDPGGERLRM
jgi:sarcosine oxidase subunit alpha